MGFPQLGVRRLALTMCRVKLTHAIIIPKGLRNLAQGCGFSATLGTMEHPISTPTGLRPGIFRLKSVWILAGKSALLWKGVKRYFHKTTIHCQLLYTTIACIRCMKSFNLAAYSGDPSTCTNPLLKASTNSTSFKKMASALSTPLNFM